MKRQATKKRPADTNMRMHSILADVVAISNQPIQAPAKRPSRKPKR